MGPSGYAHSDPPGAGLESPGERASSDQRPRGTRYLIKRERLFPLGTSYALVGLFATESEEYGV